MMNRFAVLGLLAVLALGAACTSAPPTQSLEPPSRITVTLSDAFRIEPSSITAPAGVPVTFVVTNAGALDHEFYLGDEVAQTEHEGEMQQMGGMTHDEPNGIGLAPGETKELTWTFAAAGQTVAGCHEPGHYAGGMRAAITIV